MWALVCTPANITGQTKMPQQGLDLQILAARVSSIYSQVGTQDSKANRHPFKWTRQMAPMLLRGDITDAFRTPTGEGHGNKDW